MNSKLYVIKQRGFDIILIILLCMTLCITSSEDQERDSLGCRKSAKQLSCQASAQSTGPWAELNFAGSPTTLPKVIYGNAY